MKAAQSGTQDQNLLEGLLKGDPAAVNQLYKRHFPGIVKMVTSNSGSEEDAQDLFQDAVMVIFEKARSNKLSLTSSLYTYLYAICRNLWLKKLRKKRWQGGNDPGGYGIHRCRRDRE